MELKDNDKVVLPSGAQLEMSLASFQEGEALFSSVAECLKSTKIDMKQDVGNIEENINSLKDGLLSCLTSKKVKDCILVCLKRCIYNGQKISDWSFFDNINLRVDYLNVCWEVARFNLYPFTKNLFAKLSVFQAKANTVSQKSK
ncbi:MAG: hypothetical protein LBT79_07935 [Elusimicrobiota bacterium]|jgi:hypothetical protein|nr:hypothetical protein [Elusimicrobiota bacterium]